jgi:hypothetical protein
MLSGTLHGTGVIIPVTGTHGVLSHGIIIMDISITGIIIIMDITTNRTFTIITDGTTFITPTGDHTPLMYTTE